MLTLTVMRYRKVPPGQPVSFQLDRAGGTIGRAPDNDWVLPDPEQYLSKNHCRIDYANGGYTVTDTSANGVFLNDATQPLGLNRSEALRDHDRLEIGDFEIDVRIVDEAGATGAGVMGTEASRSTPAVDDPFGLGRWEEPSAPQPVQQEPPPANPAAFGSEPGDDNFWKRLGRTDDDWETVSDHLPVEEEAVPLAPPGSGPSTLGVPETRQPIPEDWYKSPLTEPPPFEPATPRESAGTAGAEPAKGLSADDAGLLAAFLDGACLGRMDLSGQDPADVMRRAGEIMRTTIEGLREVLIARSKLKNEFRIAQTVVQVRGNNPVKFALGVDDALAALLGPQRSGYMPAVPAVRQGFNDLKAHEVATLAAVQAAFARLFRDFNPEHLKQRLEHHSILDGIMPSMRKAKYWELYEAHYRRIAGETAEDLQGVFGREFARAYEEQMRRIREQRTRRETS